MTKVKVRADEIKYALSWRHSDEFFLTEVKTGPSTLTKTLRLDALAIKKSWTQPCFTGYEIKVDRQDFLRDEKYLGYRNYCHRLYISCPYGLVSPDEVPEDIGIIYYNPEKKTLYTKRKALYREIEYPAELLYYILLSRIDNERHPFFSDQREFIQAYIEDKETKWHLGNKFKSTLIKQLCESDEKLRDMESKLSSLENGINKLNTIEAILKNHGIRTSRWSLEGDLKEALENCMPPGINDGLRDIRNGLKRIDMIVNKQ